MDVECQEKFEAVAKAPHWTAYPKVLREPSKWTMLTGQINLFVMLGGAIAHMLIPVKESQRNALEVKIADLFHKGIIEKWTTHRAPSATDQFFF